MTDVIINDILSFWFSEQAAPLWFVSTPEFDQQIKNQYEKVWQDAADGKLDDWKETAEGALALVIVLDQFPLNMYRGDGKRYSTEAKAREVARYAIDNKLAQQLPDRQLAFLYLPFMHSEDINDQRYAIELYDAAGLIENAKFAHHHHDVVARFGRFPHRNQELGRVSSAEELEYLKTANW